MTDIDGILPITFPLLLLFTVIPRFRGGPGHKRLTK